MQKILSAMRRAVQDYDMIHDGDKIFVGLSGGKDSTLLLSALAAYRRFSPEHFDLEAITVDMGLKDTKQEEMDALIAYCDSLGVKHHLIKTDIGEIIFDARKEQNPCSLCAKMRRGALNDIAVAKGCNLVALGHNREDVLETFLLSLFFEARLNTFAPITYLGRTGVTVIRPLVFYPEKDAINAARRLELPVIPANCPVAGSTKREDMKNLLQDFRRIVPDVETRLMKAIADTHKYGMWDRMKLPPRQTGGVRCGECDPTALNINDFNFDE